MDNSKPDKLSRKQKSIMMLMIVIMVVVIPLGYLTKAIPYLFISMSCGHAPVETVNLSGDMRYRLPGDTGYGISMFSSYDYCTEDQAKAAGYQHSLLGEGE